MAQLRKNWPVVIVCMIGVVLGLTFAWPHSSAHVSRAEQSPSPPSNPPALTPFDAGAIQQVRAELSLDVSALAALNLSQQSDESILSLIRNWYTENEAALESKDASLSDKQLALDRAV